MTEAFEVEYLSWKGADGGAIRCQPEAESFYRDIAQWLSDRGDLYFFVLRLNGRMIAFYLCVASQGVLFPLKNGYDQSTASHLSPGKLLTYETIKSLFEKRIIRELNFPGPCYPWIMEWTSRSRCYEWFKIYPRSLMGWYGYGTQYGWKIYLKRFKIIRRIKEWIMA